MLIDIVIVVNRQVWFSTEINFGANWNDSARLKPLLQEYINIMGFESRVESSVNLPVLLQI